MLRRAGAGGEEVLPVPGRDATAASPLSGLTGEL